MFELKGKVAVVTGSARGIGRAIAAGLAGQGAAVVIADLDREAAEATATQIESECNARVLAVETDVTDLDSVTRMTAKAIESFGGIDILVNNAGWDRIRPFMNTTPDFWDKVIAINYRGVLNTVYAAVPVLSDRKSGVIINIGSDAALVGSMGEAVYSGAKGAVISFSKSLARELARNRIRVNVVCPGPTETPLIDDMKAADSFAEKVLGNIDKAVPLKRMGKPGDIVGAVVFLASDAAAYITGQVLSVSGGLTMSS